MKDFIFVPPQGEQLVPTEGGTGDLTKLMNNQSFPEVFELPHPSYTSSHIYTDPSLFYSIDLFGHFSATANFITYYICGTTNQLNILLFQ